MKISNFKKGFTLVETLVVVALLGIISVIVTQILILAVRSQASSEIQKEVKQNGDYALSIIEKNIRNAVDVSGCNATTNSFTITNPGTPTTTTTFTCNNGATKNISATGALNSELTNNKVEWSTCAFRVVCPTPAISSKYIYINFTLKQRGTSSDPNFSANVPYQSTIVIRTTQ